jgi:hypothetical protein
MADVTIAGLSPGIPNKNTATIPFSDGSTTYKTSASGIVAAAPGCTLQVVQSVKTDTQLITGVSYVDVTGLSVSIQPRSAANKILVCACVHGGNSTYLGYVRLRRNDTDICMPTGAGDRINAACAATIGSYASNTIYAISCANVTFLDSPNTADLVTYKIRACAWDAASFTRINSSYSNRDTSNYDPVTVSTITLMEIAG